MRMAKKNNKTSHNVWLNRKHHYFCRFNETTHQNSLTFQWDCMRRFKKVQKYPNRFPVETLNLRNDLNQLRSMRKKNRLIDASKRKASELNVRNE